MKKEVLNMMNISEIFGPVIQGEGASAGFPAFFIRMSKCNLMCGGHNGSLMKEGKATWYCDSESVWKEGAPWKPEQIVDFMEKEGELANILKGTTHVILTGGEPTLPENKEAIIELIEYIQSQFPDATPFYELETNGTIRTDGFYDRYIDQVNCSVKLSNSGMIKSRRINPDVLEEISMHRNAWFKMVISDETDWDEIVKDFLPYIRKNQIMLMPAGSNSEELKMPFQTVWNIACRENVRVCGRYQIWAWEMTTGI